MIDTMLGPPPAATGSTDGARLPTDGTRGPRAPHRSDREFSSELHDAATRREPSRTDETHTKDAAGPAEGKLHKTRSDAEAAGSETPEHDGRERSSEPGDPAESTTEGADATVTDATRSALAAATAEAAATVTTAAAPAEPVADGASAPLTTALETAAPVATAGADGAQASDVAAAGQPLPQGTGAPATAAATTTVAPLTADGATATATATNPVAPATAATVTAAVATGTPATESTGEAPAPEPVDEGQGVTRAPDAKGTGVPRGAATVTLTLTQTPQSDAQPVHAATAPATGGEPKAMATAALAQAAPPTTGTASSTASTMLDSPLGNLTAGSNQPTASSVSHTGSSGPVAHSHAMDLARELGARVQVALREGGREVMLSMRPPELGHVVVRLVMHDGVLQAHIVADRPEAARMLEQALPHLSDALSERGLSLEGMDITYHHQDEAHDGSAFGEDGVSRRSGRGAGSGSPDDDRLISEARSPITAHAGTLDRLA